MATGADGIETGLDSGGAAFAASTTLSADEATGVCVSTGGTDAGAV